MPNPSSLWGRYRSLSLVFGLVLGLLVIAGVFWWGGSTPEDPAAVTEVTTDSTEDVGRTVADAIQRERRSEDYDREPPPSLVGTQPPGGWEAGPDGEWAVTPDLMHLFEYYLSALGEMPLDDLVMQIRNTLDVLPPEAREEALGILQDYIGYRAALVDLDGGPDGTERTDLPPDVLAQRVAEARSLRRQMLGEHVAEVFFADEEAMEDYGLARTRIMADDDLTEDERREQLAAAEASLPDAIRESRQASRQFGDYRQQVRTLQEQGASRDEIRALRQEQFGAEAAERLEALDDQRRDWDRRMDEYRAEVARLEEAGLDESDRLAQQQTLREQYFSDNEQLRVRALDAAEATGPQD